MGIASWKPKVEPREVGRMLVVEVLLLLVWVLAIVSDLDGAADRLKLPGGDAMS